MARRVVAAVVGWTFAVATVAVVVGGRVQMCLGPLNTTPAACRAALSLPPETD